jgi:uncharacterized protein DUF2752
LQPPTPDVWSHRALLAPGVRYLALFCVTASLLYPFSTGWDICFLHHFTGLPCPGCGMTRAFVALAAGDWSTAVAVQPFAFFAFPLFLVLGATALCPQGWVFRFEVWVSRHGLAVARGYRVGLAAFLAFGAGRFCLFLALGERFP